MLLVRIQHIQRLGCYFQGLVASLCQAAKACQLSIHHGFEHYLLFIACKVVIDAMKCCVSDLYEGIFLSEDSEGMEKGIKSNQDQSSIMLLLELNFRHNAVVLRVMLKSIMLKFSSIMYPTFQDGRPSVQWCVVRLRKSRAGESNGKKGKNTHT